MIHWVKASNVQVRQTLWMGVQINPNLESYVRVEILDVKGNKAEVEFVAGDHTCGWVEIDRLYECLTDLEFYKRFPVTSA